MKTRNGGRLMISNSHIVDADTYAMIITSEIKLFRDSFLLSLLLKRFKSIKFEGRPILYISLYFNFRKLQSV